MKKVIFTLAIAALGLTAGAQDKSDKTLKFSVGVEAALPIGDFKEAASFGFGGSLMGEYAVAETVGITLSAGYLTFGGKDIETITGFDPITFQPIYGTVKGPSYGIIPVLAGAKFLFGEKFYGHAQAGMSFFNNGGGSAFTYAPTLGVMATPNVDISVKYQAATKGGATTSFIGLRAAYAF